MNPEQSTFWEHLEVLRGALIRCIIAVFLVAVGAFMLKDFIFEVVIFGPSKDNFPTFLWLQHFLEFVGVGETELNIQPIKIVSTKLSAQLFTHLSISFWVGIVVCVPYITGEIWFFVRPALYDIERKSILKALIFSGLLFYIGVVVAYFLILPLSVNFLGNYHVMDSIENLIDLDSYIDTMVTLCLSTGISFELPIVAYFLAKIGIVDYEFVKKYRKHTFILVLVIAAIITPGTDVFTMFITALPLQLVYELSVAVIKKAR